MLRYAQQCYEMLSTAKKCSAMLRNAQQFLSNCSAKDDKKIHTSYLFFYVEDSSTDGWMSGRPNFFEFGSNRST